MQWYSAKLCFVVLLETTGSEEISESIYLLRRDSFDAAFIRALKIGHGAETEYLGGTGEREPKCITNSCRWEKVSTTASTKCLSRKDRSLTKPESDREIKKLPLSPGVRDGVRGRPSRLHPPPSPGSPLWVEPPSPAVWERA